MGGWQNFAGDVFQIQPAVIIRKTASDAYYRLVESYRNAEGRVATVLF